MTGGAAIGMVGILVLPSIGLAGGGMIPLITAGVIGMTAGGGGKIRIMCKKLMFITMASMFLLVQKKLKRLKPRLRRVTRQRHPKFRLSIAKMDPAWSSWLVILAMLFFMTLPGHRRLKQNIWLQM